MTGRPAAAPPHFIELRVEQAAHLFDTLDPFPVPARDLARNVDEFVVGWARELPPGAPAALLPALGPGAPLPIWVGRAPELNDMLVDLEAPETVRGVYLADATGRSPATVSPPTVFIGAGERAATVVLTVAIESPPPPKRTRARTAKARTKRRP